MISIILTCGTEGVMLKYERYTLRVRIFLSQILHSHLFMNLSKEETFLQYFQIFNYTLVCYLSRKGQASEVCILDYLYRLNLHKTKAITLVHQLIKVLS